MIVTLTPDQERLIREKIETGRYVSAAEIIGEALQLLEEHDRDRQLRIAELQQQIDVGLGQLDRGEAIPSDQVFNELRQRSHSLKEPSP